MATCSISGLIIEKHLKEIDNSSFPELFGDIHLKETYESSCFSSSFPQSSRTSFSSCSSALTNDIIYQIDIPKRDNNVISNMHQRNKSGSTNYQDFQNDNLSSMNSENSSTCTEDYGMENDICNDRNWENQEPRKFYQPYVPRENGCSKIRTRGDFPPPISSIGSSGQPWVYFKSYKANGRFILKEIRVQTQEFMQASRENGRLKLTFVHSESEDECLDDDEEDDVSI